MKDEITKKIKIKRHKKPPKLTKQTHDLSDKTRKPHRMHIKINYKA
jgi:hypothetical protein